MPRSRSMSIESSTCASISRSDKAAATLNDPIGQRALAVVDVGDDGEVADVVHAAMTCRHRWAGAATARPLRRRLISRSDVKAAKRRARSQKKGTSNPTRLPTKRMATACWAFIVAKSTAPKAAPMLDFCSLQRANKENLSTYYQQSAVDGLGIFSWRLITDASVAGNDAETPSIAPDRSVSRRRRRPAESAARRGQVVNSLERRLAGAPMPGSFPPSEKTLLLAKSFARYAARSQRFGRMTR